MLIIKNANVHDGLGNVLKNTDIIIEGGIIKEVGEGLSCDGAEVVDAEGKEVFPGFIDACNKWGAAGPDLRDNDMNEHTNPVNPELNVIYAFDHEAMTFQNAFEYGTSAIGLMPSFGNVLGGQAAVYRTFGNHPYNMIIKEKAVMAASVSEEVKDTYGAQKKQPVTIMGIMALLDEALQKAVRHTDDKDYDPKSEALKPVLSGEMPLFIHAQDDKEMDAVELFMEKYPNIRYVFCGAYTLKKSRESVAQGNVGAVLGEQLTTSGDYKVKYKHIKHLLENGGVIALGNCRRGGSSKESLLWNAIITNQKGIDEETVVKMISGNPAKLLGVDNIMGSVEAGKRADLSIWSGNPIKKYSAKIEKMYIDGVNVLDKEVRLTCW